MSGLSTGEIAGFVVGAVSIVVGIGVLIYLHCEKRTTRSSQHRSWTPF